MSLTLLIAAFLTAPPADTTPSAKAQEETVQRAVTFLNNDNPKLVSGKSCVNCHHAPMRGWSMREAARIGASVDIETLETTTDSQLEFLQKRVDGYRGKKWGHSLAMFYTVSLADTSDRMNGPLQEELAKIILDEQTPRGTWQAAGQFNKQPRPKGEGEEVQTMWGLLALSRLSPSDKVKEASEKALNWLESAQRGTTIDSRVLRLLLESQTEKPDHTDSLLSQLLDAQHDDGGWGWQEEDRSDAWATGMALYALSQLDLPDGSDSVAKGRAFLSMTQKENGSWHVEGKLKKNPEMASYFGTAWAVIGLARTTHQSSQ